jgi:hypothetical protein
LCVSSLVLACAVQAQGKPVKSLRLILPPKPGPLIENIGRVFARQVESHCEARVLFKKAAPLTLELAIEPGIGTEGFSIANSGV